MGRQPSVDALRVEHVVAFRKQAEGVEVFELAQAHRASQRSFPNFEVFDGGVDEDRKGIQDLSVDALRTGARPLSGAGDLALAAGADVCFGAMAEVDGEEAHE